MTHLQRVDGFFAAVLLGFSPFGVGIGSGQTPTITSVVNGASFATPVSSRSIVTILGKELTTVPAQAASSPLPTRLAGTEVLINGVAAPLFYVSGAQINLQLPVEIPVGVATAVIQLASGVSSPSFSFTVAIASPGLLTYGKNRAVVLNPDAQVNSTAAPAPAGTIVTASITGIGPVNPPVATNSAPPAGQVSAASQLVSATIGGSPSTVTAATVMAGTIGVDQVSVQVPLLPSGDYPLVIAVGGIASAAATISIVNSGVPSLAGAGTFQLPGTWFSAAVNGNVVYLCGASGIQPISITNLTAPQALAPVAVTNGFICALNGNNLLELNGNSNLNVYSLTDPTRPVLLTSVAPLANWFTDAIVPAGNMVYFSTDWYTVSGAAITSQRGEFYAYDFTNPAKPVFLSQVMPNRSIPGSSNLSPRWKAALIDARTAIVASTTATGSNTTNGLGLGQIVDVSKPTDLQVIATVAVPNMAVATGVAVQDGIALLIGNTSGWRNPATPNFFFTGNLTLAALDVTSPARPVLRGTVVVPRSTGGAYSVIGIGRGRFAVSAAAAEDAPAGTPGVIGIVDAGNALALSWTEVASILSPQDLTFSKNLLFVTGSNGLNIFHVD